MADVKQGGVARRINNVAFVGDLTAKATLEIETLTSVITFLTSEVKASTEKLDVEKDRDLKKKISERFAKYEPQIKREYSLLLPDFADKYDKAWQAADETEECRSQVDALLSLHSIRALEDNNDNPLNAIDILVEWLKGEIGKNHTQNQKGFSESAVRFFVFKEFARCNIFPNIK